MIWQGSPDDPISTFESPADAYQRDPGLGASLHVPQGAYPCGPTIGATFAQNVINLYDVTDWPRATWSFGNINVPTVEGNQVIYSVYAETDDPTSDHFGEDQETRNYGYNGAVGVLTSYDFDQSRNPNYPKIQHMLRYTTDAQFLKSGNPTNGDTLGVNCWPQLKQDPQNIVAYTGNLVAGTTIGIPASTAMPSGLSAAGQALFWCLQHYGALWRGTSTAGGLQFWAAQDVNVTILSDLNTDLPRIVPLLCPLRNQHIGGQPWTSSPKNGPGTRLDSGPPILSTSSAVPIPVPPVEAPIPPVTDVFTSYWAALMGEIDNNADIFMGVAVNSGDPQGSSGKSDTGVLNTPAAAVISTGMGKVVK